MHRQGRESEPQNESACTILYNFELLPRLFATPQSLSAFIHLRNVVLPEGTGVCKGSAAGSLLCGTFWTVWERSTLLSQAVKQLLMLLLKAATKVNMLTFRNVCRIQVVLVILPREQSNNCLVTTI